MELIIKSHQRSLCSRTSQWNFNDNFVSPTTVQFLILFNFHITILDTFNEENLTLDKPVIYRDEEIGQTGRNRFTRGIKWVRKGPGANFVGFIGRLWKLLFLTNRKSWKFCSQWQDILTSRGTSKLFSSPQTHQFITLKGATFHWHNLIKRNKMIQLSSLDYLNFKQSAL